MSDHLRPALRLAPALSAFTLLTLAGCAGDARSESGSPSLTTSAPATEGPKPEPNAKPSDKAGAMEKPGTYAIIDGEKAPIPAIPMGDTSTVARIIKEGKSNNHVMDQLRHLSESIGPRLTGSSNVDTANHWGADQFKSWGLTPAADAPSYLYQWGDIPVRFDRGPSTAKLVQARENDDGQTEYRTLRDMEFTTLSWAAGTNGPVRGAVIKMPETDEQFDAVKDKIKGAWILVKAPQPGGRRGIMSSASARQRLFADIRKKWKAAETGEDKKAEAAAKDISHYEGTATGGPMRDPRPFALDVNLTDPKNITGTFGFPEFRISEIKEATFSPDTHELKFKSESFRGETSYTFKLEGDSIKGEVPGTDGGESVVYSGKKAAPGEKKPPSMEERILALGPAGWISSAANELVITSGIPGWDKLDPSNLPQDVEVIVRQSDYDYMNSRLADGGTVTAEFDLKNKFTPGPIKLYDTIAEIKGSVWPDEMIIVSGHLDSWNGPGSQGTTDNGTGSAVTLEAARILSAAHARPKRTIRFILWTGEEQGLLGSVAYVKHLKETGQLEKVSAVLVDDGGTNYEGGLPCVDSEVPYLAAATAPVNGLFYSETDKKFMNVNIHREKVFNQVMGSDHNSFMREHIPGFFWDETGRADYNHTHHTQYDRIDQAIPEYLVQSSTCMAVTAYNLACAPAMLPRPSESEWPQRGGGFGGGGGQRRQRGGDGPGRPGADPNSATPAAPAATPRPSGTN